MTFQFGHNLSYTSLLLLPHSQSLGILSRPPGARLNCCSTEKIKISILGLLRKRSIGSLSVRQNYIMSWRCSSTSNEGLVANLYKHGLIEHDSVSQALTKVDRAHFSPIMPYEDSPQKIGYDATISAPHIHANAAEALLSRLGPGKKVLDIGSGSGYLTAVLAHLVVPGGQVVGVEHIQQLCDLSIENLKKDPEHAKMLQDGTINIVKGDGRLGYPEGGPYDAIHVGAAASTIHQSLVDQLKTPGRMFIPVDSGFSQHIWQVEKDENGNVTKEKQYGVLYVPLTDAKVYKDET